MRYVGDESEFTARNGGEALVEEWDGSRNHVEWWQLRDRETVVVRYDDGLQHEVPAPFFFAAWRPARHDGDRCHCSWAMPGPRSVVCHCGRPTHPNFIGPLKINRWNSN